MDHFDSVWSELAWKICRAIAADSRMQVLKKELQEKGFLSLEQKSEFIVISDETKYKLIHEQFGEDGSPSYDDFKHQWQAWFTEKSKYKERSESPAQQIVDHYLFGSTPDPEEFLRNFNR